MANHSSVQNLVTWNWHHN